MSADGLCILITGTLLLTARDRPVGAMGQSDVYERLGHVPSVDSDLLNLLRNRSISELEFQLKLRRSHDRLHDDDNNSPAPAAGDREFGDWISRQDGQIADQFNSASVNKIRKLGRTCFSARDCRPVRASSSRAAVKEERCFGGLRMRHLCRKAESSDSIAPRFLVQRSDQPDHKHWLTVDHDDDVLRELFADASSVAVIVHGFRQSHKDMSVIHDTLLEEGTHDVVVSLKFKQAARGPMYARAIANAEVVASFLSLFLRSMIANSAVLPHDVHVIAFSLGTQVAHFASGFLAESNLTLGRITGLDPSAVLTTGIQLSHRDADFVDVIHTSAGFSCHKWAISYLQGRVGISRPIGHVDFFPNGGSHQPNCRNIILNLNLACHHLMAIVFFANSIRSCKYRSWPCDSPLQHASYYDHLCPVPGPVDNWSIMGLHADKRRRQSLWTTQLLFTDSQEPMCSIRKPCTSVFSCSALYSRFSWPDS